MKTLTIFFLLFAIGTHAQQPAPDLRIGLVADPQYADKDDRGARFYRRSLPKLDTAVRALNREAVDFTVVAGDLVDMGPKDLRPVMDRLANLDSPAHVLLGNHDYMDATDTDCLHKFFRMPAPYYAVEKGKWVFVLLNTNEIAPYAALPGTEKHAEWEKCAIN